MAILLDSLTIPRATLTTTTSAVYSPLPSSSSTLSTVKFSEFKGLKLSSANIVTRSVNSLSVTNLRRRSSSSFRVAAESSETTFQFSACRPSFIPSSYSLSNLKIRPRSLNGSGRAALFICRAELLQEAPFTVAIGASIFNNLFFTPSADTDSDGDEDGAVSSTDARLAVMTIISLIPYFNWLSWVFALMDTGKRRYAVYALVYLAPYIRTNLSLSPDESWLPVASILFCILHIQLEASIRNGDLDGFNFFTEIRERFGFLDLKKDIKPTSPRKSRQQEIRRNKMNLPSGKHQLGNDIRNWKVPRKHSEDVDHVNEDGNLDDQTKH